MVRRKRKLDASDRIKHVLPESDQAQLSDAQAAALAAIKAFKAAHGRGPTRGELAQALDVSVNQAAGHMKRLQEKAFIMRGLPGGKGGIIILDDKTRKKMERLSVEPAVTMRGGNVLIDFGIGARVNNADGRFKLDPEAAERVARQILLQLATNDS